MPSLKPSNAPMAVRGGKLKYGHFVLAKFEFGQALYWPEPTKALNGQFHEPEIGDVGYIDEDGAFQVLFNVSHSADHESHAGPPPLPGNFVPLDYDRNLVEKKERFCTMGPLYSSGVRSQRMQGLISADVPNMPAGGTISYRFKCSRQQGAFLMLWDDATKVVVQKQERKFEEYMLDHHQKWVDYATDTKYLGMRRKPEDIILVRGTVKTSSWTVGAFIGDGREDHEVALEGRLGPVVNVSFQYSVQESSECSPVPPRSGPAHRVSSTDITTHPSHLLTNPAGTPAIAQNITDKKDQCVFLSFYKMKYRRPFPRQIRAAADVLGGGGGGDVGGTEDENSVSEYSVDVETESSRLLARSPLDHILDYILENSHAAVAITSHEDLLALNLNTDDDWPSTFPKLLRQVSPEVVVDSSGAGRLFITGTSMIRHAQAVEASQTNTLFPLDQARLALSSTTWSNSEEPNQAIVNTAQMNQLTHLQRHGIFLPLTSPAFESDFKEWCNKNNIQINRQLLNLEDGKQINLHKLHAEVIAAGTVAQLGDSLDRWAIIGGKMGFVQLNGDPPRSGPAIANRLLHVYREYLQQFDLMYLKSSLQKKLPQTGPAAQQPDMNSGNPPAGPSNPPGAQQHEGLHNNMQGLASLFSTADPNGIEELLNWSRFSSDELRAMNVPQDIIIMIDINRPTLTRQPSTQAQFQEANNNINASITMQQQQLTGPSGTPSESNAQPGHIATGTIQQQQQLAANQSRMRKTPLKAIQGPSGMQPLQPQNNAQPNCMAMPSRTMNPAPEDFRRATATAQRLRQEARAYRAANIPPPVMIPEVNRSEYNKRFEQLVRSITDLDNKLPFVMMVFAEIVPKMLAETTATVHLQRQILRSNTPRYIIDDPSLRQMSDMVGMVQEAIMKRMQGQPQFTSPPQPQLQPPFPQPQVSNPPNATMHVPSAGTPPVFTDPAPYYPLYMPPPLAPLPQPQLSPRPQPTPAPSVASTKKKQRGAKNTAFPAAASTSFANAPTATQVKSTPTPKASEPKSMAKPVPERKALAKIPLARPLTMSSLLASTATASVSASNPVPSAAPGVMDKSSSRAAAAESTYTKRRRDEEAGSSTPGPMHTSKKARVDWIQSRPVDAVLTKKKEKKKLVQPNDYSDYSDESAAGFGALSFLPTNDLALDRDQKLLDLILKHSDLSSFSNAFDEEAGQDVHENSDAVTFLKHEEESDKTRTNHHSAALVKAEEREDALWFESEEDGMKFSQDKQKGVDRWHSPTSTKLEDPEEETHDPRKQLSEDARRFIRGLKKIVVTLANPSESELEKQEEEVNALRTQFGADIDSFFSSMKSAARSSRDQNFAELTKREESPGSLDEDVAKNSARSTLVKDEKVTSDPYGNFVEKREEAGASLQMM